MGFVNRFFGGRWETLFSRKRDFAMMMCENKALFLWAKVYRRGEAAGAQGSLFPKLSG